ncbi:ankyrin repeat protein [Tupanvirus deep ocean]|uniref:Ankyrin repeat protein n=2 Tax=Tupanvirus TaxID=2094720 RepID=A0AC62A742_9VIRU|nr:ankyrin repeat protein [Tupanvirus deep ocean]QKU33596.1 ankyrin repeat protein [Tupanvirus deep ocean]
MDDSISISNYYPHVFCANGKIANAISTNNNTELIKEFNMLDSNDKIVVLKFLVSKNFDSHYDMFFLLLPYYNHNIEQEYNTLLKIAITNSSCKFVDYFIKNGADVTIDNNFPIKVAAATCSSTTIKLLLDSGADVHAGNEYPIRNACMSEKNDSTEILSNISTLVEYGADIHADNDFPLRKTIEHGLSDIVKYLVDSGANVNVENGYPLRTSVAVGSNEIVKCLLDAGASISYLTVDDIVQCVKCMSHDTLQLLISNGADISIINKYKTKNQKLSSIVKLLQQNGVEPTVIIYIMRDPKN